jgi:hypothetical protein
MEVKTFILLVEEGRFMLTLEERRKGFLGLCVWVCSVLVGLLLG